MPRNRFSIRARGRRRSGRSDGPRPVRHRAQDPRVRRHLRAVPPRAPGGVRTRRHQRVVRWRAGVARRLVHGAGGTDRRDHRPQRRRQDHHLRPRVRLLDPERRPHLAQRHRHHRTHARRPRHPRPRSLVPGRPPVLGHDGAPGHLGRARTPRQGARPDRLARAVAGREDQRARGRRRDRRVDRADEPAGLRRQVRRRAVDRLPPDRRPRLFAGPPARRAAARRTVVGHRPAPCSRRCS